MIDRIWPSSTVVCLGTGPSLCQADVKACRGQAKVIAVNDAYRLAPWADALYAADGRWWRFHRGVPTFHGLKFGMTLRPGTYPDVQLVKNLGTHGLSADRSGVMNGRNSGYQAIGLAVHLGAARIILLGYDLQRTGGKGHFFGEHPHAFGQTPPFTFGLQRDAFATLVEPLRRAGVTVSNCSRTTALTCFPRQSLTEALASPLERAS